MQSSCWWDFWTGGVVAGHTDIGNQLTDTLLQVVATAWLNSSSSLAEKLLIPVAGKLETFSYNGWRQHEGYSSLVPHVSAVS